jgi:hypothetical protein
MDGEFPKPDTDAGPTMPPEVGIPPDALTRPLVQTAPWALFLAILGYVGMGLMIVGGIGILAVGIPGSAAPMRLMGLLYLIIAGLYLVFILPLKRFADAASALSRRPTYEGLAAALEHQRCFWKRLGIVTIAGFVLSIIGTAIAVVVGIGMRAMR